MWWEGRERRYGYQGMRSEGEGMRSEGEREQGVREER